MRTSYEMYNFNNKVKIPMIGYRFIKMEIEQFLSEFDPDYIDFELCNEDIKTIEKATMS